MKTDQPATDQLLKIAEVVKLTSLSRSTIYALIDARKFPKPRRVGARRVAWLRSEVDRWIGGCEAAA
ncbi:MAG: helix-turn-helix transcriptional regulator [Oceanicaulis sp.]